MGRPCLSGRSHKRLAARGNGGFTYIALLIAVAILGIALSAVGSLWSFTAQREREIELIFIGHQFRNAIARYYLAGGAGFQYPRELQDLVDDDRSPEGRHFLRRIYRDPMTGAADWQIIRSNDGGVIGVASSSRARPIKRANFDREDAVFDGLECYCDWQFTYDPRRGRRGRHH
jgi:type II secretory pathway pseudopilin PulG